MEYTIHLKFDLRLQKARKDTRANNNAIKDFIQNNVRNLYINFIYIYFHARPGSVTNISKFLSELMLTCEFLMMLISLIY